MKQAHFIGAGPACLTAAYELLQQGHYQVTLSEEEDHVGGIASTINFKGNRMDLGGHRFFSKNPWVMAWWTNLLPPQDSEAQDERLLQEPMSTFPITEFPQHDPEQQDLVMLTRRRVSRIFYLRHFFEYPIALNFATFANMGMVRTLKAGTSFLYSSLKKRPEQSLEDFYINRFGAALYHMFFEDYTQKVWGIHPSKLGADWGSQRVKGLSLSAILKDLILRPFRHSDISQSKVETSLIERFLYPKLGPGQLWMEVANRIETQGGQVQCSSKVEKIYLEHHKVVGVDVRKTQAKNQAKNQANDPQANDPQTKNNQTNNTLINDSQPSGTLSYYPCDALFSSMPIKELLPMLSGIEVPEEVMKIATGLVYRDFITVGLLVDELTIANHSKYKTFKKRLPDTWVYIQERDVKLGRLQVFNNWSPYMVKDYENTLFLGLEYFVNEGDELWQMSEQDFIDFAIKELESIGLLEKSHVKEATQIKVKKAYPTYTGSYYDLQKVRDFLNSIDHLYCIGRNGQHRYNNMDHSMLSAKAAVKVETEGGDKASIWNINTEKDYHETK